MRFLAIALASFFTFASAVALAESGEEMRARGEQLAKDGRFTEATDAFKAAASSIRRRTDRRPLEFATGTGRPAESSAAS